MNIDDVFSFGKYKGLTIREVFQGTNSINNDLLKSYLLEKIALLDSNLANDFFLLDVLKFEISETLIRATPDTQNYNGNFAKNIENIFIEPDSYTNRFICPTSLDEYNLKKYSINKHKPELTSGNPEYIDWCIKNVDFFFMNPEELLELQNLDVFVFAGIEVVHKIEDIYEYKPKIKIIKAEFSSEVINLNRTKYDSNK